LVERAEMATDIAKVDLDRLFMGTVAAIRRTCSSHFSATMAGIGLAGSRVHRQPFGTDRRH
jgi:hypothetical protein